MKKIIMIFLSIFLLNYTSANIEIYFFHGEGCPYCTVQKGYLEELKQNYNFNIKDYEIYHKKDNLVLMKRFSDAYQGNFNGVPITIIGTDYFLGADKNKTENLLKKYDGKNNYPNPYNIVLAYENENTTKEQFDIIKTENSINIVDGKIQESTENIESQKNIATKETKLPKNCISPRGEVIQHGNSIQAYKSEIGFIDQLCIKETRNCIDGNLNGTYIYKKCEQKNITIEEYKKLNYDLELESDINVEKELSEKILIDNNLEENIEKQSKKIIFIIVGFIVLITSIYLILFKIKK